MMKYLLKVMSALDMTETDKEAMCAFTQVTI